MLSKSKCQSHRYLLLPFLSLVWHSRPVKLYALQITSPMDDPSPTADPPQSPLLPPPQDQPKKAFLAGGGGGIAGGLFSFPRPPLRLTSEFDSDSKLFLHKASCHLFDRLAKLKLSFQHDSKGGVANPQLAFLSPNFSVLYDVQNHNALLQASFALANVLNLSLTHDVKITEPENIHLGCSAKCLSVFCNYRNDKSVVTSMNLGSVFLFKYHYRKDKQGDVTIATTLDPNYKLQVSSSVPALGLLRANVLFPYGQVSLEEKINEEVQKVLSVNGIVKANVKNGLCAALFKDNYLNLKYCYKDEELSFIPTIELPSNALSFAFKRRFSPLDKLSYWYHFSSNDWSTVYKRTISKDLKFKAGYDSEIRLGWASLWVGEEEGKVKTAPFKMKAQFMLQVPHDEIRNSIFMFRLKKRWDF